MYYGDRERNGQDRDRPERRRVAFHYPDWILDAAEETGISPQELYLHQREYFPERSQPPTLEQLEAQADDREEFDDGTDEEDLA